MNCTKYLLTGLLWSAGHWLTAQTPLHADSSRASIDTARHLQLEEVAIQTVRAGSRLPVTELTLQQAEIQHNYTGQEMPVILGRTPSVTWYADGGNYTGYSYMRLRGIDQTRINFTLNGVPLNEPEDQGAYFSNYPDFLNSIRSIQIQRGVGISTNGTAGFGGAINMESPSLGDTAAVELTASYGSYNTYRLSPEFSTGLINGKWSFYGRYSLTGSDGFREHSGTRGQSFFMSGGYLARRGMVKFTAFTGSSNNEMAYLPVADTLLKCNYRSNPLTRDETDAFRQSMAMLQYVLPLGKHSTLSASAYYTYLNGGYGILFGPDLYNYSVKSDFYGALLNYSYTRNRLKLHAGLHANDYARAHYSSLEPFTSQELYRNTGHKQEFSAFVKGTYELGGFTVFGDLQYRSVQFSYTPDARTPLPFSKINWQFLNPKGGISYAVNAHWMVYASVGQSSREPTRNDLFAGYDNIDSLNYGEVSNFARVKPERVTDYELGIRLQATHIRLDLNAYNMEFRNEIAAIGQLSYIGLPLRKNVAESYRRGLELTLKLMPLKRLVLTTQANASRNRIRRYTTDYDSMSYANVQPLLTPELIFHQTIEYGFTDWLHAEAGAHYLAQAFLDNTNNSAYVVPSSLIFHASLSANVLRHYSLSLLVNNLGNTRYYTAGQVQGSQPAYFAMATRNYMLTLKARF